MSRVNRHPVNIHVSRDEIEQGIDWLVNFLGTTRFLGIQTVIVAAWVAANVTALSLRWDPYPFILLNLAFSTQAAYAAPMILHNQNKQAQRDRIAADHDYQVNEETRQRAARLETELAALREDHRAMMALLQGDR